MKIQILFLQPTHALPQLLSTAMQLVPCICSGYVWPQLYVIHTCSVLYTQLQSLMLYYSVYVAVMSGWPNFILFIHAPSSIQNYTESDVILF